jgi:hypothetical protein
MWPLGHTLSTCRSLDMRHRGSIRKPWVVDYFGMSSPSHYGCRPINGSRDRSTLIPRRSSLPAFPISCAALKRAFCPCLCVLGKALPTDPSLISTDRSVTSSATLVRMPIPPSELSAKDIHRILTWQMSATSPFCQRSLAELPPQRPQRHPKSIPVTIGKK